MTTHSMAAYERRKIELASELAAERKRHEERMAALRYEYKEAEEQVRFLSDGLDTTKILHAEHILAVLGKFAGAGDDRMAQRESAIREILIGGGLLRSEYIGTKDYDRWHGQASNHTYGYGPKHGSIIFSIELLRPIRERGTGLTEDEIESAVYYLRNLERIEAAAVSASTAAAKVAA